MKRRDFLKNLGFSAATLGSYTVVSSALINQFFISNALGAEVSLHTLEQMLSPDEALVLVPGAADFTKYNKAFNLRTFITPSVRVLCLTEQAIIKCLQWAQEKNIALALRNGGHSYEGFSSSKGLVIDVRLLEKMTVSTNGQSTFLTVQSGAKLGQVYEFLAPYHMTIPAGSCPTVGVTGHTTGGGYGLLARTFGLACDSLVSARVILANGTLLTASESENADLFWALRGGGGGSFGIVSELTFRTSKIKEVVVFGATFTGDQKIISTLMKQWFDWAPTSAKEINCLMKVQRISETSWSFRVYGQRVPLESEDLAQTEKRVNDMLTKFIKIKSPEPDKFNIKPLNYIDAVRRFAGAETELTSVYMKAKSDYIKNGITEEGIKTILANIPMGIVSMFDSYGGAINNHKDSDMAFAHRENTLCSIQHYSEWRDPDSKNPAKLATITANKLSIMNRYYSALRPYVSGNCYFNYCDLEIENYATAYWGKNLPRLIQIKNQYDPKNVFQFAQSIPLVLGNKQLAQQPTPTQHVESLAKSQIFQLGLVSGAGQDVQKPIQAQVQLIKVNGASMLYARFAVHAPKIYAPQTLATGQYPYQYEAIELFLRTDSSTERFSYYEIELSPYNQTFQVRVDVANSKKSFVNNINLNIRTQTTRTSEGWVGEMWIPTEKLNWSGRLEDLSGNLFAILGEKPNRSFFSAFTPTQEKPNFHLPELFKRFF